MQVGVFSAVANVVQVETEDVMVIVVTPKGDARAVQNRVATPARLVRRI